MKAVDFLAQVPVSPDEVNPAGQMLIGLGLSGAMLVGFLFLVAILIAAMLVMGWSAHRDTDSRAV